MLDVTMEAPLAMPQTRYGQVLLALQNCQSVFTGIHILLSSGTEVMLKRVLQNSLPNVVSLTKVDPIDQLETSTHSSYLGTFALTQVPTSSEPYYCLDFQDKHFPASFINWLIESSPIPS
ncbi:Hypothetical predicted protein [Lynx pardinus]|uniref:Uncharacterized protein n=1 Tax=Lynx pardinus TaxID=191816 RepID=A0A485M898_LYNPA|nr:Hypothetical predicted protein [Lynx pardinus]